MVNKVTLIGNVGRDPESKTFENGRAVANFSLATTKRWKNKDGEQQEKTQWHNVVCWTPLAELVTKYVKKGSMLYIEGELTYRSYDKDGETRWVTEIEMREMKFLVKNEHTDTAEASGTTAAPAAEAPKKGKPNENDDLPF